MKKVIYTVSISLMLLACKENIVIPVAESETPKVKSLVGTWDNFQQYWQENTAEDQHRIETDDKHRHLSMKVTEDENGHLKAEVREGRNGRNLVENISLADTILQDEGFQMNGDTLYVKGIKHFENKDAYKFIRARMFSGWIEYPIEKDSMYHQGNLEISDQGGMAELDIEGVDYTMELTQLVFAKKLAIMKLAVYDMPMDSVGINSRSISYTWLNPEAKRTGINLRKIVSGWTLIEPGYVNQNSWRKETEEEE